MNNIIHAVSPNVSGSAAAPKGAPAESPAYPTWTIIESARLARVNIPMTESMKAGIPEYQDRTHFRITLAFDAGGMDYFSGNTRTKAYRLTISPVAMGSSGFISSTLMGSRRESGGSVTIEACARYNKNRLRELAQALEPLLPEIVRLIVIDDAPALVALIRSVGNGAGPVLPQAPKPEDARAISRRIEDKLLPVHVLAAFAAQGDTSSRPVEETKVIAKYFTPDGACTWYATEYNPADRTFFGFANLGDDQCAELGNFGLDELLQLRGKMGLPVERDLHFGSPALAEVMAFKVR